MSGFFQQRPNRSLGPRGMQPYWGTLRPRPSSDAPEGMSASSSENDRCHNEMGPRTRLRFHMHREPDVVGPLRVPQPRPSPTKLSSDGPATRTRGQLARVEGFDASDAEPGFADQCYPLRRPLLPQARFGIGFMSSEPSSSLRALAKQHRQRPPEPSITPCKQSMAGSPPVTTPRREKTPCRGEHPERYVPLVCTIECFLMAIPNHSGSTLDICT